MVGSAAASSIGPRARMEVVLCCELPQPLSLSARAPPSGSGSSCVRAVRRRIHPGEGRKEGPNSHRVLDSRCASRGRQSATDLVDGSGAKSEATADHVIAATGYRVNLEKLQFLSNETRSRIKTVAGSPALSSTFESSVPGLYFVGLAAANSFGPVMRFAFGADFTARTVTRAVAKLLARKSLTFAAKAAVTASK